MKITRLSLTMVILFSIFGFHLLFGQDLADLAFFRSQDLRIKMGLNIEQTQKMENTLLHFSEAYKKLLAEEYDETQTFSEKYEKLKQEREKELKTFLDARQLQVFNVIQEQRIQYLKDFYESTRLQLAENDALVQELAAYNHNVMLPDLLNYRAKLNRQIDQKDSLKLIEYAKEFDAILDDLLAEGNLDTYTASTDIQKSLKKYSRKDPETKKNFKGIQKMLKKYNEPLNKILKEIDPHEDVWRKDINQIVNKHLPVEEQESYTEMLNLMGAFGVSQKIDPLVFLLFDPTNENSYFQLKRKLYRVFVNDMI